MKIKIIAMSIFIMLNQTQAGYIVKIPLEQLNNGSLPNNSILFKNKQITQPSEIWMSIESLKGDWLNDGEINCTVWSPDQSTVKIDEKFTQTAIDCEQNQTRTVQQREQEKTTLEIRNSGPITYENQMIIVTDTREAVGKKEEGWVEFADARGLDKNWNDLRWDAKNLTKIPKEPYPLTSITNIYLNDNKLKNIDGLSGITNVTSRILVYGNELTNVDGLINITNSGILMLYSNNLSNIEGIKNIQVSGFIRVDASYSGPKLSATTRFCSLNTDTTKFQNTYAKRDQLCAY